VSSSSSGTRARASHLPRGARRSRCFAPATRFVLFIVERGELERDVDMPTLMKRLARNPVSAVDASLRRSVDRLTYSRIFIPLGLAATPTAADTTPAMPL